MKDPKNHLSEKENTESPVSEVHMKNSQIEGSIEEHRSSHSKAQLLAELMEKDIKMEELFSQLEGLEKEKEELKECAARSKADLYNFRQRIERERAREKKLALESSVLKILPVLDNLDRALSFPEGTDPASVLEGVVMVQRQFINVLNAMGVKDIPTVGEAFSPEYHEAVALKEVIDPDQDGLIVEEFMKGYIIADKVIRPARVQVAKYVQPVESRE